MAAEIEYQNNSILTQIKQTQSNASTYTAKAKYQNNMYQAVRYFNQCLMVVYVGLFILIHGIFLHQYLSGIKRNEFADTVWLTVFFLYPYLIYPLEKVVYFCITYVLSLIYGKTYVFQFDQWLSGMDFYKNPKPVVVAGQLDPDQTPS